MEKLQEKEEFSKKLAMVMVALLVQQLASAFKFCSCPYFSAFLKFLSRPFYT